jgi:hypothetical protein
MCVGSATSHSNSSKLEKIRSNMCRSWEFYVVLGWGLNNFSYQNNKKGKEEKKSLGNPNKLKALCLDYGLQGFKVVHLGNSPNRLKTPLLGC